MSNTKIRRDRAANRKKKEMLNPEAIEAAKKIRKKKIICGILLALLAVVVIGAATVQIFRAVGKHSLKVQAATVTPVVAQTEYAEEVTEEEQLENQWQEGWVKYDGRIYAYNEDILTFLIMGIDKNTDVAEVAEGQNGGQADALFLVVLNPHKNSTQIIAINRNSMVDVDYYDQYGSYVDTVKAQIAVQHGYGNGVEESCEYQVKAVSRMFYKLPIHGYAAINMSAIATMNDAVGGITVTALDDIRDRNRTQIISKGELVTLQGDQAFWYVKYRDTSVFGSADGRLARQKQFLQGFISQLKTQAKSDLSVILDLYYAIDKQMVTSITSAEVSYLAPEAVGYSFNTDSILSVPGETVQGEKFEEYNVDQLGLYELILDVFYEEVKR